MQKTLKIRSNKVKKYSEDDKVFDYNSKSKKKGGEYHGSMLELNEK